MIVGKISICPLLAMNSYRLQPFRDSINAEDAVVFLNFRADRAIQLTQALTSGFKHNGQLYPPLISPERMMTATSTPTLQMT